MKTEYNHGNALGISNIWQDRSTWSWSNRAGEGCGLTSFQTAVNEAEAAILSAMATETTTQALRRISETLTDEMVAHAAVCEFNAEDNTPTLHVDLWRGLYLSDLPQSVASLKVAAEGSWDGGRAYSLQLA